jgi:hypothetical protein
MGNMNITISEDDFKGKSSEDRDWMLFQGISNIHNHGCNWERKKWKTAYPFMVGAAMIGGALVMLVKHFL